VTCFSTELSVTAAAERVAADCFSTFSAATVTTRAITTTTLPPASHSRLRLARSAAR
jgi:hypothetical protein